MNDADRILGPKKHAEMPTTQRTHFARYPDVQVLCDTFLEEMDFGTDLYTIRQIAAGARDFKQAIGNKPDVLLHTIKKMRKAGLTIASPRSCISTARKMTPDGDSEEARQRYAWED